MRFLQSRNKRSLAMVALLSGAGWVEATDLDPEAVDAARRNLELNQLSSKCRIDSRPLTQLRDPFDLVVANLEMPMLLELSAEVARLTAAAGTLVVSGFMTASAELVVGAFEVEGLRIAWRERLAGWELLQLAKD